MTIIYEDLRGEEPEHIVYHEEEGIIGFVRDLNKKAEVLHDVVYFKGESEGITVKLHFSIPMSFMKIFWASVTIFTMRKAVLISLDSRRFLQR